MKKSVLLFLIYISCLYVWSQNTPGPVSGKIVFMPPQYYVGDFVDVLIPLPEGNPEITIDMTPDPWLEIISWQIEAAETGSILTLRFISYYPGVKSLPEITAGTRVLSDIKINTRILSEGQSLKPLKSQVLLPSTILGLGLILSLLIMVPLSLYFIFKGGRWLFLRTLQTYRYWKPFRAFQKKYRKLRADEGTLELKELYYQITEIVRNYLGIRINEPCLSAVTGEMESLLGPILSETCVSELVSLFEQADRIKFAGELSSIEQWAVFADQISVLVKNIEKEVQQSAGV